MGLLHKESYDLCTSFLSVTPGLAPAHKARTSPPSCLTLWQWELSLQLKRPQFLYHFSSTTSISSSSSPPPGFFFFKREKCQFELPAWQTPLRNWYGPDKVVFIYFSCCKASQVLPPTPLSSFQYCLVLILPDADSVTRNVCSETLLWWKAADKKIQIILLTVPLWSFLNLVGPLCYAPKSGWRLENELSLQEYRQNYQRK